MALDENAILKIFKDTGALLEGHFILTSGAHSGTYFQCARVFQHPRHVESLARDIADHFRGEKIDVVVSPAVGGIVLGQEVARLLPARAIFTERVEERMVLRRGFELAAGERVLVVEDVTTTGGSVSEVIEVARAAGAVVVAVTAVVDRSSGRARFDVPYFSLVRMDVVNYAPGNCPLCRSGSVAVKPGSRNLKS